MFSLGDFQTIWRLKVVSSQDIIDVVDSSWSKSDFGEVSRPNTTIGIFSLILRKVRSVNVVVDVSKLFHFYLSLSSHS